jgi:acetyltransferase
VLPTPERAARAVAAVVRDARQRLVHAADARSSVVAADLSRDAWDEDAAKQLVGALGIATPAREICATHADARDALSRLGAPVAVKALHPALEHKTEAGAVHLGVADIQALERALEAIDMIDGVRYLVEAMAAPGPELILGARRDPAFGSLVALGAGGTAAEALDDVSVRLAPLGPAEAATMLRELASTQAFLGSRGEPAVNEDELATAIVAFGDLIAGRDDIAEIEINPLRVTRLGLVALDALVVPV